MVGTNVLSSAHEPSTIVVAHVRELRPVTMVRSTMLQTSIRMLRTRGHFERYREQLPPELRDEILLALAPTWLPFALAVEHYRACDRLDLPASEIGALGESGADALQGIFLATLVRGARAVGITPWTLLSRFDRTYSRLFQGGSVEVIRLGPKGARLEWAGFDGLAQVAYFRTLLCGNIRSGFRFVGVDSSRVEVVDAPGAGRVMLAASWS